jgi:1-deoxy-D-xylulose-5-phosphate reductoisomerase
MSDAGACSSLKKVTGSKTSVLAGPEGIVETVESLSADVVVSAIVGSAGLLPTLSAIRKGIRVAVANKEPLVMAGRLMTSSAEKNGATIIPIDSEHSAVWQCLNGEPKERVKRILLTASGGPFLKKSAKQLEKVKKEEALKHPKWKMGKKITIDSSTLMNKGLEVIEARWLFGLPLEKIEVIVHPQSVVHSMVEFEDRSVLAQLGRPDMYVPIAYALSYPDRWPAPLKSLDITKEGRLDFFKPDRKKFPCLQLAYDSLKKGGLYPAALNGANEVAVELFLSGKIGYMDISRLIRKVLGKISAGRDDSLESIIGADREAREMVRRFAG